MRVFCTEEIVRPVCSCPLAVFPPEFLKSNNVKEEYLGQVCEEFRIATLDKSIFLAEFNHALCSYLLYLTHEETGENLAW